MEDDRLTSHPGLQETGAERPFIRWVKFEFRDERSLVVCDRRLGAFPSLQEILCRASPNEVVLLREFWDWACPSDAVTYINGRTALMLDSGHGRAA